MWFSVDVKYDFRQVEVLKVKAILLITAVDARLIDKVDVHARRSLAVLHVVPIKFAGFFCNGGHFDVGFQVILSSRGFGDDVGVIQENGNVHFDLHASKTASRMLIV